MNIVINSESLDSLRRLGRSIGKRLLEELVQLYAKDAPWVLGRIEGHLAKGEFREIHLKAHALKSSSTSLGMVSLGSKLAELEAATGQPSIEIEKVRSLVLSLRADLAPTISLLLRMTDTQDRAAL